MFPKSNLRMKLPTYIFMLLYASFRLVSSAEHPDTRQAIPVAMVASKALTGHAFTNNTRLNDNVMCNRTSPYCDPFINQQYKLDQAMKSFPTSFNITDSTYNASIVHALASNKTTVTRNKTIVFLQNQVAPKVSKLPTETFQTLKELTNMTFPLNKTITNKTIYIPPYGSFKAPAVPDQSHDLSVPFSQAVETGKISIPSFVNKAYMPEVGQSNTSLPFNATAIRNDTYILGESSIPLIQHLLGHQISQNVPVIQIELKTNSPFQSMQSLTEPANVTSNVLNQTSVEGQSFLPSYTNTSNEYIPVNRTEDSTIAVLDNAKFSPQQNNLSFTETSTPYAPSMSVNDTYTGISQGASASVAQNTDSQLNDTLKNYGLFLPPPTSLNTQNSSSKVVSSFSPYTRSYTIHSSNRKTRTKAAVRKDHSKRNRVSKRRNMHETKHKEDKRQKLERKANRKNKVYGVKKNEIKNKFHFATPNLRRYRRDSAMEVSEPNDEEPISNERVKRYVFDYNSADDVNELPELFPADGFDPLVALQNPVVALESPVVKTSRSDISQPPLVDLERPFYPDQPINLPGLHLIDTNAYTRGRIEIPDNFNYERSLAPIGEPAKQMIDQLLAGKAPEHFMDNFFPNRNLPISKSAARWASPSLRDDITHYSRSNSDLLPRSKQDEIKEEEMDKVLNNFDRQTQKIANLYKYVETGSRDDTNSPHSSYNEREDSQNELNDPQRNNDEGRGWGSSSYHPDSSNTVVEEGKGFTSQEFERNSEDNRDWGHPDQQNSNYWDEGRHDHGNLREESELKDFPDFNILHGDGRDHADLRTNPDMDNNNFDSRRNLVDNPSEPVRYNREEIMRELLNYIKIKQQEAALHANPPTSDVDNHQLGETRSINNPPMAEANNNQNIAQVAAFSLLKKIAEASQNRHSIPQDATKVATNPIRNPVSTSVMLQDSSMDFPMPSAFVQSQEKTTSSFEQSGEKTTPSFVQSGEKKETLNVSPGGDELSNAIGVPNIAKEKGVVMLVIASPKSADDDDDDAATGKKEVVEHKELTSDGVTRSHPGNAEEKAEKGDDDADDFSQNLKEATNLVLGDEIKAGNITTEQRDDIEEKLSKILDIQRKNKTIDQFITSVEKNSSTHNVVGDKKSKTPKADKRIFAKLSEVPADPVMYLNFEQRNGEEIPDKSKKQNNAKFEDKAGISKRVLGTCGKAAEMNDGSITWKGSKFRRKPEKAVTIALWVKVKKSGVINWFANGKQGDKMFYTQSKGAAVPAKVWTHVAGTFDSKTGLARIYINGNIEQETQKSGDSNLSQNWLVNGIGEKFGDDSMQYVDELLVYDRALNSSEVRTLANRCVFNRMILHYGFQDGNKTYVHDQSGLENNAILTGGALTKKDCNRCGYCMDLQSGPDPSLKIQQISLKNLPRVKVSIAVWISLNDTKGVHNIFRTESGKGNIGYHMQVKNGKIRWYIASDKGHTIFDNTTKNVVVPESLWTHVIVSYNNENGAVSIYVNSILKFKDKVPESRRKYLPINWDNDASIGDSSYHGYLDEFIMYNWELDSSEVLYVRNYCADHPKLVRFTVRVPLTKKTSVPGRPRSIPKRKPDWWAVYKKLLDKKNEVTRRTISSLHNFQQSLNTAYPLLK